MLYKGQEMKDEPRKAWNSSLNQSKTWSRHPKKKVWSNNPKPPKAMRPIAKKKWDRYSRDRSWTLAVYVDYLRMESFSVIDNFVFCPRCGREKELKEMAMDHIDNRNDFPERTEDPHNFQPLCREPCNRKKFHEDHGEDKSKRNLDHRGEKLRAYMEIRILSDWTFLGKISYPDELSGAWEKTSKGLVGKPQGGL